MKLWACALGLTAFLVGPAHAEGELDLKHGEFACNPDKGLCVVRQDDLQTARKTMAEASQIMREQQNVIERQERELRTLRDSKGCARLTVIPKQPLPGARGG